MACHFLIEANLQQHSRMLPESRCGYRSGAIGSKFCCIINNLHEDFEEMSNDSLDAF